MEALNRASKITVGCVISSGVAASRLDGPLDKRLEELCFSFLLCSPPPSPPRAQLRSSDGGGRAVPSPKAPLSPNLPGFLLG